MYKKQLLLQVKSAVNEAEYRHMAVLPGRGKRTVKSEPCLLSLEPNCIRQQTGRRPFPSALWLTAQCHNYTNVFTAQTVENQLSMYHTVDFTAAESPHFHLTLTNGVIS